MTPERILLNFCASLYCVNAVLWQWFAHNTPLALFSVAVAISIVGALKLTAED